MYKIDENDEKKSMNVLVRFQAFQENSFSCDQTESVEVLWYKDESIVIHFQVRQNDLQSALQDVSIAFLLTDEEFQSLHEVT